MAIYGHKLHAKHYGKVLRDIRSQKKIWKMIDSRQKGQYLWKLYFLPGSAFLRPQFLPGKSFFPAEKECEQKVKERE